MDECTINVECDTFERGRLLPGATLFHIVNMEVWGCGGDAMVEEALRAQSKDRSNRAELIRKARMVDKASFAGNSFDQEFLLTKTFAHKTRMSRNGDTHTISEEGDESDRNCSQVLT